MNETKLKNIVEAALLAAGSPLSIEQLLNLFDEQERPERAQIREAIKQLQTDWAERGIELKEVASGFRPQVKQEYSDWIGRLYTEKPSRYSRALLETLALIAYRQPITRGEIEDIRGVSVSTNIIKTLLERDWVKVVGHRDVPGKPAMYGTTRQFLDYFNLKSLDELPTLAELRDIDSINAELDLKLPGEEDGATPDTTATDAAENEAAEQAANDAEADHDDDADLNAQDDTASLDEDSDEPRAVSHGNA